MSYHHDVDHPLADITFISTPPGLASTWSQPSGSFKPSEDMPIIMMAHGQPDSGILVLRLSDSESTVMFLQVDSSESDWPAGEPEVQVEPPSSLTSAITMSPSQRSGRKGAFAINGDSDCQADLSPELHTITSTTTSMTHLPQTQAALPSLSGTSESRSHHDDAAAAVQRSKAQSRCSAASLNVATQKDQDSEVDPPPVTVSQSPSSVPAVKRVMIRREKTGTDWQSVFDIIKLDMVMIILMILKELETRESVTIEKPEWRDTVDISDITKGLRDSDVSEIIHQWPHSAPAASTSKSTFMIEQIARYYHDKFT
ncbi:uncharacterized protein F5891DRAFT_982534 [Suillus fuscotomentosus]|uniref:Uncharacterized protein n=1 Tax=Suillus fuscotomentosus TaxID=1912939 RepID=A0AAD4E0Z8_9AGAM|nr:uncharacterized protein F5891DRAFT_982534 [Suillus fuscotomentosus]KAG1897560.1 hypothetical protein F5891DRAFT_982534 [Suillus fuscotomentosus]